MTDSAALITLAAQYCHRFDDGELDAPLGVFESGATVEFGGQTHRGRAELSAFFTKIGAATKGGRHNRRIVPAG